MPETVKFVEFVPGHTSEKSGKFVPPKVKDGNGKEYAVAKEIVGFVAAHLELPLEIESETTQNGRFTNHLLTAARLPLVEKGQQDNKQWFKRDPAESSLILRQVALKAAVELIAATLPWKDGIHATVLATAEQFNDWLHGLPIAQSIPAAEQKAQPTGRLTTHLRAGESLAEAAQRAVKEHDEQDLTVIPPADATDEWQPPSTRTPYPRERLRPSRGAVR